MGGTSPKKLMKTQAFLERHLRPRKRTTHKSQEVIETYQICKTHIPTPKVISAERSAVERSLADLLSCLQAVLRSSQLSLHESSPVMGPWRYLSFCCRFLVCSAARCN